MESKFKLKCDGMVCPIPVAKTKKMMAEMKSGDILEVSGDFCEAGENIKRFVENHGGTVLEFNSEGQDYCLTIQKI